MSELPPGSEPTELMSSEDRIKRAAKRARKSLQGDGPSGPADVGNFVECLYRGLADRDLRTRNYEDLYGAALAVWQLLQTRREGQPIVRVYNPEFEQYGWQSTHTAVEVVTRDMPFLVDSVRMALNRAGLTLHLVIHPVLHAARDDAGKLTEIGSWRPDIPDGCAEAVMQFEVDRVVGADALEKLRADVTAALNDVAAAVDDWPLMQARLDAIIDEWESRPPPVDPERLRSARAFLAWLADNHFTFVGYREYELDESTGKTELRWGPGPGLGIRRDTPLGQISASFAALPDSVRADSEDGEILIVTKSTTRATVHRPGYLDYVGIRRFDANGKVIGEQRFLGLFTSAAYASSALQIPLIAEKVQAILEGAGFPPASHARKALLYILESYPRDLLFQTEREELSSAAMDLLQLQERQHIRLIVHVDRFRRFASCIVYVPRERFNTERRILVQTLLERELGGTAHDFTVQLDNSVLARLSFIVQVAPESALNIDRDAIETRLRKLLRDWTDDLHDALVERLGEARGVELRRAYDGAFGAHYREYYTPRMAVRDVEHMCALGNRDTSDGAVALALYRPLESPPEVLRFKLFRAHQAAHLSDTLPMLENMGLRVTEARQSEIVRPLAGKVWLYDFELRHDVGDALNFDPALREAFEETFAHIWHGWSENDGFNRLVLTAGLRDREITALRAYCKYLRQIGVTYSQAYMEQTLAQNPVLAVALIELFKARFDPATDATLRDQQARQCREDLRNGLESVVSLDEDRILRGFIGVIEATLRTNYFVATDSSDAPLAFKFDCAAVPDLPEPRPLYEVFVYSPRFEGIHLRGDKVARGGLRWSDRPEDFRTEILGLVKAQMVKNAVIVPMGSKGGFVPKRLSDAAGRDAMLAEGVACYRSFIAALLSLTDNLDGADIKPPSGVVRYDDDDPYLVVAADKGTATFSDEANEIAVAQSFWLGDAFASGGSDGYDHKGMGITARGAWESVKRHFRGFGVDTQSETFTVAGIGDMSGDVFGNGMLLSPHIALVAAFNHMHIFLDPTPDTEAAAAERARLFAMPRSSWTDYDESLISAGGGIFARSAKSIDVTSEVAAALGIEPRSMTPAELVSAILAAPVDLLWNGGIGTYVAADGEADIEVGDRANDAVRVRASALRCKVVGEGGNLGLTQAARIQFAERGGRIFTDAIDNSAGVDCSDHEVNIKVVLASAVNQGDMTAKQRSALLASMTDEVAALVLQNNYQQTQALQISLAQAPAMLDVHERQLVALERDAGLDRRIEGLPAGDILQGRRNAGLGLHAPELSVLMAYTKIELYRGLLDSPFPDSAAAAATLHAYFPAVLQREHAEAIGEHRLRREIAATVVANELVNRQGVSFVFRLQEEAGQSPDRVAGAYLAARDIFAMPAFWKSVEDLDNVVDVTVQTALLLRARRLVERASRWLLRSSQGAPDPVVLTAQFAVPAATLAGGLTELVSPQQAERMHAETAEWEAQGVPAELASRASALDELLAALDLAVVAKHTETDLSNAAASYFALGERLNLGWLRHQVTALPRDDRWQSLARSALRDDLMGVQAEVTRAVLKHPSDAPAAVRVDAWLETNAAALGRAQTLLGEVTATSSPDFAVLSVAMRELRALSQLAD